MTQDIQEISRRKLNFFQTLKAVAWGFLGVRKGKGYSEDTSTLNPVHLILAGLLAAAAFVIILAMSARWIISYLT